MKKRLPFLLHSLQGLALLLMILAGYVSYGRIRQGTNAAMTDLKTRVILSLEESLGYSVLYDEISPSLLAFLEVRNLRLVHPRTGASLAEVRRLKLFYNPLQYLFNREEAVLISHIHITGLRLSYEEERDRELLARVSPESRGTGGGGSGPDMSRFFSGRIRIRSWEAEYTDKTHQFRAQGNTITLRQQGGYMRVKLSGDFSLESTGDTRSPEYIRLSARISGNLWNSLDGFNLNGDFRDVRSSLADVNRQRLNVRYAGRELRVTKIQDSQPYDLSLVLNPQRITLDVKAEEFSPGRILSLKGPLAEADPWLSTVLTGTAHFERDRIAGEMDYSYEGTAYIQNEKLPFAVHVTADVSGDEQTLTSRRLRASSPHGILTFAGEWAYDTGYPVGSLGLSQISLSEDVSLNGSFDLTVVDQYFYMQSRSLELNNGWQAGAAKALVSRKEDRFIFSLRTDLNPENPYKDQVLLNGELSFAEGFQMESAFLVHQLSAETLIPFAPANRDLLEADYIKSLLIRSEGSLTIGRGDFFLRMDGFEARSSEGERHLKCSGFMSPEEFEIYALEVNWNSNSLLGSLNGFSSGETYSINSSWNINNNSYLINGIYSDSQFSFIGNHGLKGRLLREPGSGFLATLEAESFPLAWDGREFQTTLNVRGRYRPDNWEVYWNDSSLRWINSDLLNNPEISLTAYMAPGVINLFSLGYKDDFSDLRGSGALFFDLSQRILNGSLSLSGDNGDPFPETYSLYCVYNDGNISSSLQLRNALLDRYASLRMKGGVNAEVTLEGSLNSPVVEGQISTERFVYDNHEMGLQGRFRLNSQNMELYDLEMRRNTVTLTRGLGFFNFQDGTMMFTSRLSNGGQTEELPGRRARIESGVTLRADTGGPVEFRRLASLKDRDFEGRLRIHPVQWNDLTTYPSRVIDFSREDTVFSGQLQSDASQSFFYDTATRDVLLYLGDAFPVSFQMEGNLDPEQLDVQVDNLLIDLNLVNYFMPKDRALDSRVVVFREDSVLEGEIHIGGDARNPDFTGSLSSRNLLLLTPYTTEEIGETDLRFRLNGNRVDTNLFTIPVAGGRLVSRGFANFNGWTVSDYSLDISAEGDPGTPFTYNAFGLQGAGAFTGNLRLYGTNQQGGLEGTLVFNELVGSLGTRTEREGSRNRRRRYPFLLDLEFVTGRNVLFILPNPQLEIVRATAEQGQPINLTLDTSNRTLSMTGALSIRSGEINYFDRSFQMTEGALTFNESEISFNPFLNLEAEIDTTDINGEEVTVFLSYRNPIRDEFTPNLRTEPAMSEDQIMALFGQSLVPYDTEEVDLSTLVLATGGMVSEYGFVEPFESALKDSLNLDSVTIKTEILENALLDQLEGYQNFSGTESSYNLGRYLDNTSISLGQFLGDYLFLSAGLLVDYDELSGVGSYTGGMSLVPELQLEMRTPFFLVAWNYNQENIPDNVTENDFVLRNAISLEWRFSY